MVFVRARRSATIRTRMDVDLVRSRLGDLAASPEPGGMERFTSKGWFTSGWVGEREFRFEYYFNNPKNSQVFDVEGRLVEEPDWRVLRVKMRARNPWLEKWLLVALVFFGGLHVFLEEAPLSAILFVALFLLLVMFFANYLYIPDVVSRRVAALLASQVRGSVKVGSQWVVPERED